MSKEDEKNKGSRISVGELFGMAAVAAAAGFVMGMLFAPRSGLKTRKVLNAAIRETIDRLKFLILEAQVMSEEMVEMGRKKADKIASKVKAKK
jgi:gas vesicle protein